MLAFVVRYPRPADTARLFAWDVEPSLMPMILGGGFTAVLVAIAVLYLRMHARQATHGTM